MGRELTIPVFAWGDATASFQLRRTLKGLEEEVAVRKKAEEESNQHRNNLGKMVAQRTNERETVNEELRQSEVKFRELINLMGGAVAIFGVKGNGEDFIFQDFYSARHIP